VNGERADTKMREALKKEQTRLCHNQEEALMDNVISQVTISTNKIFFLT
jgi:hypothetical protein